MTPINLIQNTLIGNELDYTECRNVVKRGSIIQIPRNIINLQIFLYQKPLYEKVIIKYKTNILHRRTNPQNIFI